MYMILGLYLIIILNFSLVLGGGHLSVRLVEYVNPGGRGSNNRKCDGRFGISFSKCDHRFVICIDKQTGGNSVNKCPFGRIETPVISNADVITFPDNINGMKNPLLFNITSWPASGRFKLKIDIWDDDSRSKDEHVELLYRKFVIKPSGHRQNHTRLRFMLHRRTRLVVDLAVFCDDYYFGKSCDIYCRPRNDYTGHYVCNRDGLKVCLKGWKGPRCTLVDHCADLPCKNNGTCLSDNRDRSYFCECQNGFSGKLCDIQLCQENVCKNEGVCYLVNNTNVCDCPPKWTGERCDTRLASCDDVTCFNNGTCAVVVNKFKCRCQTGWHGIACLSDIDECRDNPCHGNSKCINTDGSYFCKCLQGWSGNNCSKDVNECKNEPCPITFECVNTEGSYWCRCPENSTVNDCSLPVQECSRMTCQNNGTCIVDGERERCLCREPWKGEICSELKDSNSICKNSCIIHGQCKVDSTGNLTCTCQIEDLCDTNVHEVCATQKAGVDINISYPVPKMGTGLIRQGFFQCMEINITKSKVVHSENPNQEKMNMVLSSKFAFGTSCSFWLQESLKNCSRFLFDDDQFQKENGTIANRTSTEHLIDRKGSKNWYPLISLLVVPLLIIACFLVLRKTMKKTKEPETVVDDTGINISFGNSLYAEINGGDNHQ